MKTFIKLTLIINLFFIASCESSLDYKYADQEAILSCDIKNKELIKEAVYAFENYLRENYKYRDLNNLKVVYSNYWTTINSETPPKTDNLTEHTKNILEKMLKVDNLFINQNGHLVLNQNSEILKCIAQEIQDEGLKTTFNALLNTKTLKPKLFIPAIRRNTSLIAKDKALATYIALQQFYAVLAEMDLTVSDQERFKKNRANKTPDNHDGHNH